MLGGAGSHQITHTSKTHTGEWISANSAYDAAKLCQAACHESSKGVITITQTNSNTASNSNNVFSCSTSLNTAYIRANVGSEVLSRKQRLETLSNLGVFRCYNCCRNSLFNDLFCVVWTGKYGDSCRVSQLVSSYFVHKLVRTCFHTLGEDQNINLWIKIWCASSTNRAQKRGRSSHNNSIYTGESLSLTSGRYNIVWKLRIRKMSAVDVFFINGFGNISLSRPNNYLIRS